MPFPCFALACHKARYISVWCEGSIAMCSARTVASRHVPLSKVIYSWSIQGPRRFAGIKISSVSLRSLSAGQHI